MATLIESEKIRSSRIVRGAPVVDCTLTFEAVGEGGQEGFWPQTGWIRVAIAAVANFMVLMWELLLLVNELELLFGNYERN